jgi:uncharacterized protein (TIGR02444 family)
MTAFPEHPFWDFSLQVYGGAGVAPACLALQDRYDLDVNLLLLCCWIGRGRGRAPSRDEMARLCEAAAGWHRNVVRPLRGVRRWLKAPGPAVPADQAEPLRQRIKGLELDAEHAEQLALAALLGGDGARGAPPAPEHAATALRYYFEIIGISPDDADRRQLTVLLAAAFPETPPGRLAALLAA